MESQAVNKSNGNEDYANWKNADENLQGSENERTTERQRKKWDEQSFTGNLLRIFFSYLKCNNNNNHHHVICKSISVFSMGKIMCYKYEFSVRCFFFSTWRFALCLALQNDGILYAKCHSKIIQQVILVEWAGNIMYIARSSSHSFVRYGKCMLS